MDQEQKNKICQIFKSLADVIKPRESLFMGIVGDGDTAEVLSVVISDDNDRVKALVHSMMCSACKIMHDGGADIQETVHYIMDALKSEYPELDIEVDLSRLD